MSGAPASDSAYSRNPLSGLKVLDLGQIYNGPYAGFLLAMGGADVVKIEPLDGEAIRGRGGGSKPAFAMAMLNSNKRGLALNLKAEAGKALFLELAKEADVVLENFAPGVMDKLGAGASVLQAANPGLIYASSTGYGLSGPSADGLAMDLTIQAACGVMSINGPADGPPLKTGLAICDFYGGIHLYAGIMTALYERSVTGLGRQVEIAMQEATYPALATNLTRMYNLGGVQPERRGNAHPAGSSAPYNVYPASDGHVAIICVREHHWQRLRTIMGRDDLEDDPRFIDQPTRGRECAAVDEVVSAWTRFRSKAEITDILRRHRVPVAPVRELPEVNADTHMRGRGMLLALEHPDFGAVVLPHSPLRFHGEERVTLKPSPALGQHTCAVLHDWLNYGDSRIEQLITAGVIGAAH